MKDKVCHTPLESRHLPISLS